SFLVQALKHLLEAVDVPTRLLEVSFERRPQFRGRRGLCHLGQRLGQLFLRIVGVTQFIEKRIVQCAGLSHGRSPSVSHCARVRSPGFITTLIQASSFSRNGRYISGASSSVTRWVMMKDGSISPRSIRSSSAGMYLCMWVCPILSVSPFANAAPSGNLSSHPP